MTNFVHPKQLSDVVENKAIIKLFS